MKNIQSYSLLAVLVTVAMLTLLFSCEEGPNFREFDYPAPIIYDFHPKQGYIGSDVIIEGENFGDAVGAVKVYFGGVLADTVRSVENNKIVVQAPPNGTTGILTVEIFGKKDTTDGIFTYLPSARLTAVNTDKALVGDVVTIFGDNFGTDLSLVEVFIGSNKVEVLSVTPTEVVFMVPDIPSGNILLIVDGQRLAGPYLMVGIEKLVGRLIGHSGSWSNDPATTIEAAVDGNMDTYVDAPSGVQGYVGYDLGEGMAAIVRSVRYVPRSTHTARMVGGEIRGSNDPSLTEYVVLHTITETPPAGVYSEVAIDADEQSFRYIYYLNPKEKNCNLAEIEFYGNIVEVEAVVGQYIWDFSTDGDNQGWEPQGATWTVSGGALNVTFPQATGKKRADLKYTNLPVILHTGTFPIVAMKADIPAAARITFDTEHGEFGPGFNKYSRDFLESHGVYYWDISVLPLRDEVRPDQEILLNKTFQFKIADIPEDDPATGYSVEWIRTFASVEALESFLNNNY
jgi:hypothetical protein